MTSLILKGQSLQTNNSIDFEELQPEIEWFIKKTKSETYESGKYSVYLVKIYGSNNSDFCISLGYIQDSLWISELKDFKYYIELENKLVLLQIPNHLSIKNSLDKKIRLISNTDLIQKTIYPGVAFLSTPSGYVCCFSDRNIVKIYYDDADKIPDDKRIFTYTPQGLTIKVDSSLMKSMFKKKKN